MTGASSVVPSVGLAIRTLGGRATSASDPHTQACTWLSAGENVQVVSDTRRPILLKRCSGDCAQTQGSVPNFPEGGVAQAV